MTDYEIWDKILNSADIKEIEELLKKVIKDSEIVQLIVRKFSEAKEELLNEEKELKVQIQVKFLLIMI